RILPTEVWYPARYSGRDAPIRRGRFPLVLVAHGHCGLRTNYTYLTTHLASWGFVVAAPDFPGYNKAACDRHEGAGDVVHDPPKALERLRAEFAAGEGEAARFRRALRRGAGLVGHSLGGFVVLQAAVEDPGFRAVVALAPAPGARFDAIGARPARERPA